MKNYNLTRIQTWQYKVWQATFKWFGFDKKIKLLPLDFAKPWYQIILDQKLAYGGFLLIRLVDVVFFSSTPLILTWIISNQNWQALVIFIMAMFVMNIIHFFGFFLFMQFSVQVQYSLNYHAHRFFLNVDPIHHTTRSSGKIIAKIDRSVGAFDSMLDIISFEILYIVVSFITTISILFSFHPGLGLLAAGIFVVIVVISIIGKIFIVKGYEPFRIKDDDAVKATSLENLQSIQLIRASFASGNQDKRLQEKNRTIMTTLATLWQNHVLVDTLVVFIYTSSTFLIGWMLLSLLSSGTIETAIAVGLMLTYFNSSRDVIWIGGKISRIMQQHTQITDLFKFIRSFGKQSYPVLQKTPNSSKIQKQLQKKDNEEISIKLENLHFDYEDSTRLFSNHFLNLSVNRSIKSKLYGIIGPSGTGKTTLLSIIGGQLKPSVGSVFINNVNMYSVNDQTRKYMVGLQMQTATSLRGSLRYNMLFGLPGNVPVIPYGEDEDQKSEYKLVKMLVEQEQSKNKTNAVYNDKYLTEVLEKVGLWHIFSEKKGLDTLIGEGGLNLSGGQRQRLNFASLYLRSQYYQPDIIMIDEPTSSLDEISERSITNMILDLAKDSVTLVIAHRLKTLEDSQAILDLSLLEKNKQLSFYDHQELNQYSDYYQKLMSGELDLDK